MGGLFVDQKGTIHEVPDEQLDVAKQAGWAPAGKADIQQALKVREAGSITGQAKTALEGAGAGLMSTALAVPRFAAATGSKLAGGEFETDLPTGREAVSMISGIAGAGGAIDEQAVTGAKAAAEAQRLRAVVNPLTADASYVAGQVVGAMGMGLSSGAQAVGGATTKALGGGMAARIAGAGVVGAVEGAPLGLIQAQDQAYLDNRKLTAEQSVAAAGLGGLLGFGLGAGTKLAGEGLSKIFGSVRTAAERLGAEQGGGALRKALGTGDESINNAVATTLNEPLVSPKVAEYVRDGIRGGDLRVAQRAAHEEATTALADATNEALSANRKLVDKLDNRAWKLADVETRASSFAPEALGETKAASAAMRQDIEDSLAGLGKDANKVKVVQGLRERLAVQDGIIQGTESPAKAYIAMDQIRRDAAATSRALWHGVQNVANVDTRSLYEAMAQKVGAHYDDSFRFLMDEGRWGAQGVAQQEANTARAALIQAEQTALPKFASEVGTTYEGQGMTRKAFEADEGKIIGHLQRMGTTEGAFAERRAAQWLDAAEKFSAAAKKYGIGAEDAAAADAVAASAKKFRGALATAKEKVGSINQAQSFLEKANGSGGVFSGSAIGSFVGGAPGAAAGAALGAVMNPAKFLAQRIQFEQMAIKTSERLGGALDRFFAPMSKAAGVVAKAGEIAQETGRVARTAAYPTVLGAFGAGARTPELAFARRREEILTASMNANEGVRNALSQHYGEIASRDTAGYAAAVMTASNSLDFLRGKMPEGGPNLQSMTPMTSQLQPNKVEIQTWANAWNAISDPISVVEAMADGDFPAPEAMEAIQTVYPSLYAKIRLETMSRLREMDTSGQEVPPRQRLQLDVLLDLNGAGEPTFAPNFGARYGAKIGAPTQEKGPAPRRGGASMDIGKRLSTQTSSMIGGGT